MHLVGTVGQPEGTGVGIQAGQGRVLTYAHATVGLDGTVDPWGNDYLYTNSGTDIDIYTLGSDVKPGGESAARDIHWIEL